MTMRLRFALATAAMAAFTATQALAQQPAPAAPAAPAADSAPIDPATLAAAEKLVAAMGAEDQAKTTIASLKQALIGYTQSNEPSKVIGFTAYADKELAPGSPRVMQYLADVAKLAAEFYARRFSVDELNAITAFQSSAAGRKFQAQTPELGAAIAERTMQFQSDLIRTIQQGAAAGSGQQ